MLISEVIQYAADLIGLSIYVSDWSRPSGEAATLLKCYHAVENEVALDYFPLRKRERLTVSDGKILYTKFSEAPVDIVRVEDGETGTSLDFRILSDGVLLSEKSGAADVEYTYSPEERNGKQSTPFPEKISLRLLAYGTASEYCFLARRYDEAKVWGMRYRDALRAAGILRRKLSSRSRRWV